MYQSNNMLCNTLFYFSRWEEIKWEEIKWAKIPCYYRHKKFITSTTKDYHWTLY